MLGMISAFFRSNYALLKRLTGPTAAFFLTATLVIPATAVASGQVGASKTTAASKKSEQPSAQDRKQRAIALPTITVTAQYTKQNLQKTPIAITAINSKEIQSRGYTNVLQVAQAAPNVTMTEGSAGFGSSNQTFIRGIGQNDFSFAFEPRVAFYVDNVYYATVFGSIFDLLDVNRVEVLRGPQGTLFGRNSVGGAIRIFTKKPEDDDHGYLQVTGGSFNHYAVKGAMDVPLVGDKLLARFTAGMKKQDGYVDRLNFACVHPSLAGTLPGINLNGSRNGCKVGTLGGTDVWDGRAQFRFIPNDKIEDNFSVDYTHDSSEAPPDVPIQDQYHDNSWAVVGTPPNGAGLAPNTVNNGLYLWLSSIGANYGLAPTQQLLSAMIPANKYATYAIYGNPGFGTFRPGTNCNAPAPGTAAPCPLAQMYNPPINTVRQFGWSNIFDWQIASWVHFKYIMAWREYTGEFGSDVNSLPIPIQEVYNEVSHHQWQHEIQFTGTLFNDRLDWTAGAFYLSTYNDNSGRVQTEGFSTYLSFLGAEVPFILDNYANDSSGVENESGFVNAIWHVTDKLNLTAGVRYTNETKHYHYVRAYPYQQIGAPLDASAPNRTIDQTNPRIAVDYSFTPNFLVYASYATGFTAGGNDPRPFAPSDTKLTFGPEKASAYEAGIKSEWFDHRMRLNLAGFLTDFNDIQLFLAGCASGCPTTSPFYYGNGGDAQITGFEAEWEAQPTPDWYMSAYAGYTHFEYTKLSPYANASNDPTGLTLNSPDVKSPDWKLGASTQYNVHLGDYGTLTPRVDLTWTDTVYFGSDPNNPLLRQKPVTLVNARLTWKAQNPNWTVAVFVNNLTNQYYLTNTFYESNSFGVTTGSVAPPREWGVTIRRDF